MISTQKEIAPNTCAHCKWDNRNHGMVYHRDTQKIENWVASSNALRLERMKANRELRKGNLK